MAPRKTLTICIQRANQRHPSDSKSVELDETAKRYLDSLIRDGKKRDGQAEREQERPTSPAFSSTAFSETCGPNHRSEGALRKLRELLPGAPKHHYSASATLAKYVRVPQVTGRLGQQWSLRHSENRTLAQAIGETFSSLWSCARINFGQ